MAHWRRFLPKRSSEGVILQDGSRLSTLRSSDETERFIQHLKSASPKAAETPAEHYKTLLLAQTPKAVAAQAQMDKHPHGYHNREKRLYELIDFNDTFVAYVLATPHAELPHLTDRLWDDMQRVCGRMNSPMFTPEQYDAIVRGLSREIAVYRSAKYMKFGVDMTNRVDDAFGIDLVITQPETGKQLNVDCKTPSAFRHRMEDLVHHGRISDDDLLHADEVDHLTIIQHRDGQSIPVTLLCIRPETLGDIHDFTFDEPVRLKKFLDRVFLSVE